ncbi:interleukin-20 receptor subunit alpha-like [Hypanus sabinus]|uniref:interleukin-20 receptor subunit alpha-like n=1 Tax=Hypanus sabinus TaxID=79690 RepID=UPI0028C419D4|nr:interleukin-20 receptor subunit alpha-like [Hypanus sabinus]
MPHLEGLFGALNGESGAPKDVKFISQNLHNVLHWKLGNGTENTTYFVQHKQYGQPWSNKTECWGIRVTCCDLTEETKPYFENFFARVRAFSFNRLTDWTQSETFHPIRDTVIGPPEVEVISSEKSLLVKLIAPLIAVNGSLSVKDTYLEVKYNIILSVKAQGQANVEYQRTYITNNNSFEIQHLSPGTSYCVSVQTKVSYNDNIGDLSREQCVTLAEPRIRTIQSVIICSAGGIIVVVALSIYLCFKYRCIVAPRPHYPAVLTTWNNKKQECLVFYPQIIEQPDIDKGEFIDISDHPCPLLLQNKCLTNSPYRKYINVKSPGNLQHRDFDSNSMPLGTMAFCSYLEMLPFSCSDYVRTMVEFDSLLPVDQSHENIGLRGISREHWQSQVCVQNKLQSQDQEGETLQTQTEFLTESPEYINQDIWQNPDLNNQELL